MDRLAAAERRIDRLEAEVEDLRRAIESVNAVVVELRPAVRVREPASV